jgi:hypothetical protein
MTGNVSWLKLCGPGEWLTEKHGTEKRRSWKKLHVGVNAQSGRTIAVTLTDRTIDDAAQIGPLLDQVPGQLAALTGDGAYDRVGVYAVVARPAKAFGSRGQSLGRRGWNGPRFTAAGRPGLSRSGCDRRRFCGKAEQTPTLCR